VLLGVLDGEEVAVKVLNEAKSDNPEEQTDAAEAFAEFQREAFIMR